MENDKKYCSKSCCKIISALILSAGLLGSGYFVSQSVLKGKMAERTVIVKGLVERAVTADYAVWPITLKETSNDLIALEKKAGIATELLKNFLLQQGLTEADFSQEDYLVTDKLAKIYHDTSSTESRYLLFITVMIKTANIEAVKKAAANQHLLAQQGVVIGPKFEHETTGPFYEFTQFNAIKPELLSEAIKSAYKSAEQFAIDSGNKVGKLKTANQGSFVISAAVDSGNAEYDTNIGKKSIQKKIRAVSTLEYFLE